MKKVMERLSVLKMTSEERTDYYHYLKEAVHSQDVLMAAEEKGKSEGIQEGEERGIVKGKAEEKAEIAKAMLAEGASLEFIQKVSGLTLQQIEELQKL